MLQMTFCNTPFFDGFYSSFYEIIVYYKTGFIECAKSIDNTF